MKTIEFESHGAVLADLMQTHEPWGCNPVGFSITRNFSVPADPFAKPAIDNRFANTERFELSEWVDCSGKHLPEVSIETGVDEFSAMTLAPESFACMVGEARPRKSARRHYGAGISIDVDGEELWCGYGQVGAVNEGGSKNLSRFDEHSLSLLTLLLECAVAISADNLGEANRILLELTQLASPYGPSCAERVVAYFAKAMASRVMNSWLGICSPLRTTHKGILGAFQVFNNISPFIKFAHFTSNQAILEALHDRDRVHIIDMDIMQGLQWPALFHILANRIDGPPQVRMTGMGSSMDVLEETGRQLSSFAKRMGMPFEFHPIAKKFSEVNISMVQGRRGEAVAVHWLQHSLYDATGPDWKATRLLEQLSPRVITLVEQEIAHVGTFLDRFVGSLHYYSTIFDSLGAMLPYDDPSRHRVEHCLLLREINNILAIGGPARSGEDKFNSWRMELANRCFTQVPMSSNSMAQAQLILNMFPPSHGYTLLQGDGTLRLGWKDTSLYTASAWTSNSIR